jgi:hypothetical protein
MLSAHLLVAVQLCDVAILGVDWLLPAVAGGPRHVSVHSGLVLVHQMLRAQLQEQPQPEQEHP